MKPAKKSPENPKPQHSPLPWKVQRIAIDEPEPGESGTIYEYRILDAAGDLLNVTYDADYAALIVRAVNAHEALIAALESVAMTSPCWDNECPNSDCVVVKARAALRLAREGK